MWQYHSNGCFGNNTHNIIRLSKKLKPVFHFVAVDQYGDDNGNNTKYTDCDCDCDYDCVVWNKHRRRRAYTVLSHEKHVPAFLRWTAVRTGRYCWARIRYGNSVRLSVTTRYRFKPRWDRDSGFSPYDSLEYLVSYEVIWCHWVRRFPSNGGIK